MIPFPIPSAGPCHHPAVSISPETTRSLQNVPAHSHGPRLWQHHPCFVRKVHTRLLCKVTQQTFRYLLDIKPFNLHVQAHIFLHTYHCHKLVAILESLTWNINNIIGFQSALRNFPAEQTQKWEQTAQAVASGPIPAPQQLRGWLDKLTVQYNLQTMEEYVKMQVGALPSLYPKPSLGFRLQLE